MITDAQFQEWLDTPERSQRCVLVEADWRGVTDPVVGPDFNVALSTNGATAYASSEHTSGNYPASRIINGERAGATQFYWNDDTSGAYPDWFVVDFGAERIIDRVNIFSVQDNFSSPSDPPTGDGAWYQVGTLYVLQDFDVQVWQGSSWQTIASVRDNFWIKRQVSFYPYRTSKIRIYILATPDNYTRCTELEVFTPSASSGTEYLSTMPFISSAGDSPAHTSYLSLVKSIPNLNQSMSDVMFGRTTANVGAVTVFSGDGEVTDDWLFKRDWIGRGVRMYVGDVSWPKSDFRPLWAGVIATINSAGSSVTTFEVRDLQHLLNQPLSSAILESGPQRGVPGPFVIGKAYNVPAILIDDTTHRYRVHDNTIGTLGTVYDSGKVSSVTNLGDGSFTFAAAPIGRITADITSGGTSGALNLSNASDMIKYLVTQRGYLTVDQLDIDSFNALKLLCLAPLGYATPSGDTPIYQAVDEIVNTIGAFTSVTREGKYFVKRFELGGTPVMTINESDIELNGLTIERIIPPVKTIRIAAKKNNAPNHVTVGGFGSATELMVNQSINGHFAVASTTRDTTYNPPARSGELPNPNPPKTNDGLSGDSGTLPSLFTNEADAQAEANRRMTIWGFPRYVFGVRCIIRPLRLKLGDAIILQHSRYGLSNGRVATVVKINERMSYKRVQLSVIL